MILARNSITVSIQRDIDSSWRFYKIASSTATPSAPTEAQGKAFIANHSALPSGWTLSEPSYDGTSTNSLYYCDLTGFTDGNVSWSPVSKSTSYEAAKAAYNKAAAALDAVSPIATKTYTNVYCTANSDPAAWLYFASVKPENYYVPWTIRYKVYASIDSLNEGKQTSEVMITGSKSTYYSYQTNNSIINTSYRPIYAHILYTLTPAGVTNGYGHLLGIRFQSAYNPNSSSYARTIKIEVLEAENCEVTVADSMYLYANAAGSGSTNYSTRTGFDGTTQGVTMAGDRNTNNTQHSPVIAGANGVRPYSLIMRDTETTWVSLYSSAYNGINQGKVRYEGGLKLGEILYSAGSGNYASGTSTSTTYSAYNVDLRYSMNMAAAGAASYKPVYLVGEIHDDGLFYLDENYWTDDPTDISGKVYVFIGTCSNNYSGGKGYSAWLSSENTAYTFYDGEFIRYEDAQAYEAKKTATNYLSSDNTGIMVADMKYGEQTPSNATGRNVFIDNDSVNIRNGNTVLASFAVPVVIGDKASRHVEIDTTGFITKLNTSKELAFIGIINDPNNGNLAEVIERHEVGEVDLDGVNVFYGFTLKHSCTQLLNVAYNGSSISNLVTLYNKQYVKFTSSGSTYSGKFVAVKYYTSEIIPCLRFGTNHICRSANSVAFGIANGVYAANAFSTGTHCVVYGDYAVAEGDTTSAIGTGSHSEGIHTFARGAYSHADGAWTEANAYASHASGEGSVANSNWQNVIGKYNVKDGNNQFAFIIGNGTDDSNRSNAFAVTWDGIPRGSKVQHNNGSTFSLTQYNISGFMDGNSKVIILGLETERYMDTVETITVTSLVGAARGVNGYINGSSYNTNWKTSAYTILATKKSRKHLEIRIQKSNNTAFSNAVANSPVSLYANITLKFEEI